LERLKCLCFSEGAPYLIKDYPDIIDSLDDALISVNNRNASFSWKITGFSIVRNTPVVVFPKNYTVPITDAAIKEEASILFRSPSAGNRQLCIYKAAFPENDSSRTA